MNFLAHTYLSFGEPGLIVGNYLGDFVTNKTVSALPLYIQSGVLLHRYIDSYTDAHPRVKEGTKLLHPSVGKYAPVVLDIYFDFLLSKFWSRYEKCPLSHYCEIPYQVILDHRHFMPESLADRARRMVADRWLENYQHYNGLRRVFGFLSKRARFKSNLETASEVLMDLEAPLGDIFNVFFPELIQNVRTQLIKSTSQTSNKSE